MRALEGQCFPDKSDSRDGFLYGGADDAAVAERAEFGELIAIKAVFPGVFAMRASQREAVIGFAPDAGAGEIGQAPEQLLVGEQAAKQHRVGERRVVAEHPRPPGVRFEVEPLAAEVAAGLEALDGAAEAALPWGETARRYDASSAPEKT